MRGASSRAADATSATPGGCLNQSVGVGKAELGASRKIRLGRLLVAVGKGGRLVGENLLRAVDLGGGQGPQAAHFVHRKRGEIAQELLDIPVVDIIGSDEVEITGVNIDSRRIKEGHFFVAMKGTQVDVCFF